MSQNARKNVLVVDDDPSQRVLINRILELYGLQVQLAQSGVEALELLQKASPLPDLILLDIQMPELDGHETLCQIKATLADKTPPIIGLSGSAEQGDEKSKGFADYIIKPFGIAELSERLEPFVDIQSL